jgi:serine/threonine protein kinase
VVDVHDAISASPPPVPGVDLVEALVRTNLSEVWKGIRGSDGAAVVVKFATPASDAAMLRQEAMTVEALQGCGVSGVIPAEFEDDPVPHLVLPWKGSRTMRAAWAEIKGEDDRARAMAVFLRLVEIVSKVHQAGFLHGDLKPENVILDGDDRPWLTDFGMARAIRSARLESQISLSMSRSEKGWGGTLHYLPPEGLHGEAPTQGWDVYALGVMLHEILLGSRPDRAATPESLKTVLPGQVVEVLLEALAYSPEDRLPSASRFRARLEEVRDELTATGLPRWIRRSGRLGLAGLAAFFVALRYGMVIALVVLYVGIFVSIPFVPAMILAPLPFVLLHFTIRWEGIETDEEARLRRSGQVVGRS